MKLLKLINDFEVSFQGGFAIVVIMYLVFAVVYGGFHAALMLINIFTKGRNQ